MLNPFIDSARLANFEESEKRIEKSMWNPCEKSYFNFCVHRTGNTIISRFPAIFNVMRDWHWPGMDSAYFKVVKNALTPLSSGRIVPRVRMGRVTPFIPRERPNVKHSIASHLRLPRPRPAPALMRELHWHRS